MVSECRLADLSSSHRTLSSDHGFMPHSAAMPHCIRKPLCLPGPQPLCPSVFVSHLLTAGIRHAPLPGDVPTCHAMSHCGFFFKKKKTRSRLRSLSTSSYLSSRLRASRRHDVGFTQIILLAVTKAFLRLQINRSC